MPNPSEVSTLNVRTGHPECINASDVRCPPHWCALNMFCGGRWGAPRLWAAALSSLPACAPSPLPAHNLPRLSYTTAAHPRTSALTLSPLRLTRDCRRFLFGRAAARSPLSTLLSCGAPPALFHPAGVRASCGRARPATLSSSRGAPCAYYVSSDIASGHAQSACDTMQNVHGIV